MVCVFYTSIGGLKTVIWTDFLQFGIIVACFLTVFGIGLGTSGGITSVWSTAEVGGRLEIFKYFFAINSTVLQSPLLVSLLILPQEIVSGHIS